MTAIPEADPLRTRPDSTQGVILDTDIGTDVDDAYAVLLAVSSPEIDLRAVTLVHADVDMRYRIARKLLDPAGRPELPVLMGERYPLDRSRPLCWAGHEGRGLDFSDVPDVPEPDIGVPEFLAQSASESPGEIVLITIGPLTNAGAAIRDFPRETAQLRGIVAMGSTFGGYGPEHAGVEHNIALDPEATEIVLNSGIPVFLVGLNVTRKTALTRSHLAEIARADTPLSAMMAHMTEDWLSVTGRDQTPMHDPLALAAFIDPGIVETVPVRAEVSTETAGLVTCYEADEGSPIRICTEVDVPRFDELFYSRIYRAVAG